MVRERKINIVMKIFYILNLIFCSFFILVVYYEGLDEVFDDALGIDLYVEKLKYILYFLIFGFLFSLIVTQITVELHIFFLMCKLHYLEFKRVKM